MKEEMKRKDREGRSRAAHYKSGDPLDQGYFPVGESLNILNP